MKRQIKIYFLTLAITLLIMALLYFTAVVYIRSNVTLTGKETTVFNAGITKGQSLHAESFGNEIVINLKNVGENLKGIYNYLYPLFTPFAKYLNKFF